MFNLRSNALYFPNYGVMANVKYKGFFAYAEMCSVRNRTWIIKDCEVPCLIGTVVSEEELVWNF